METKICSKCLIGKLVSEFNTDNSRPDRLYPSCKECRKIIVGEYSKKNSKKINEYQIEYKKNNLDKIIERNKIYYLKNKEKIKKNNYSNTKKRRKNDILFKLRCNLNVRIRMFMKSINIVKDNPTFDIIGCTPQFLKEYLEKQFTKDMSWENHGLFGWHIDHIIPLSSANTEEELYKLCHYTNLQPLWAKDNLAKSNKLPYL
jgi:hypothetical protein